MSLTKSRSHRDSAKLTVNTNMHKITKAIALNLKFFQVLHLFKINHMNHLASIVTTFISSLKIIIKKKLNIFKYY